MVRLKYFVFLFFLFSIISFSADWPVKDITGRNFSSFFGENRGDHFHNGVDIVKKDAKIYPTDKGEVLFYYDEDEYTTSTLGLGKYVILDHYEYRSYYCHLDTVEVKNKVLVDKTTSLGVMGNSGRSSGQHLHFAIKKDNYFVDPFNLIKEKVNEIKFDPIVESILFKSGYYMSFENEKDSSTTLPFREVYDIYVNARTFDDSGRIKGIKSVGIEISNTKGERIFYNSISFDYLDSGKINSKYTIDDLYFTLWNKNYIYLGRWEKKLRKEKYTIVIKVKDQWDNTKVIKKDVGFK